MHLRILRIETNPIFVGIVGLEPTRIAAYAPRAYVSTNSTILRGAFSFATIIANPREKMHKRLSFDR